MRHGCDDCGAVVMAAVADGTKYVRVQRSGGSGGCCDVVRTVGSDAVMVVVMRSDGDCSDLELVGQYSI